MQGKLSVDATNQHSIFHGKLCGLLSKAILKLIACLVFLPSLTASAAIVRGTVTDTLGLPVTGATVVLIQRGKILLTQNTSSDGIFQFTTGKSGFFFLIATGTHLRLLKAPSFAAGTYDVIERKLVMEPEWVRDQIVTTATGNPISTAQTAASVGALDSLSRNNRQDVLAALRLQTGAGIVQKGRAGSLASLYLRGANADANQILFDGSPAADTGGQFDLAVIATTGVESVEMYRGANSALFGTGAEGGVLQFTTVHGTTSTPSLTLTQEDGNFNNFLYAAQLGGTRRKLDYYGAFTRMDAGNALPMDTYHDASTAANIGWHHSGWFSLRATGLYQVSATGVPNAHNFYGLSDDRKRSNQNIYAGGQIRWTPTINLDNKTQYSLMRKREESRQWYPAGIFTAGNYYGNPVTICGANGYCTSGQALLNYSTANAGVYPNRLDRVNNADRLIDQATYSRSPRLTFAGGFRYEHERANEINPANNALPVPVDRTNYGYNLLLSGNLKSRLYYTLGSGLDENAVFGTEWTPRISTALYLKRPAKGILRGTKINFNFGKAVREPSLTEQDDSLYSFLKANGGQSTIAQLHIRQLAAPTSRDFDGGLEQHFLSQHIIWRNTYFHNEYGRQLEAVTAGLVPTLLPNLTSAQQATLMSTLQTLGASALTINSQAFLAQGIESQIEAGLGKRLFLRTGYTYLDAVVQHSFDTDVQPTLGIVPTYKGIPVGMNGPLKGARPFNRPPHSGFALFTYADRRYIGTLTTTFATRSDDSTFLGFADLNRGNSLLLPNRNLDQGWIRLDLGGSIQLDSHFAVYTQFDNLTSNQHIAPIGYPSLPFTFRTGIRIALGRAVR
jgi:iron complex outermembrane receptor protein/vitamin B12 transporter